MVWILKIEKRFWFNDNYGNYNFNRCEVDIFYHSCCILPLDSIDECHSRNIGFDKNGVMKCFDNTYSKHVAEINNLKILTIY